MDVVTFDRFWVSDPPAPSVRHEYPDEGRKCTGTLNPIRGDIRNPAEVDRAIEGVDILIHLACISNDPGFDLDPRLGKEVNYDSLSDIMESAYRNGVERIIYASSSSVYGDCGGAQKNEGAMPEPLTDYAKYKWYSERKLAQVWAKLLPVCILRPATLFGWTDTAMRFDLMFNSFVAQACVDGEINVRGGDQWRSLLHVQDMVDLYVELALEPDVDKIAHKTWNVCCSNHKIGDLALMIAKWRAEEGHECQIRFAPTLDRRSYAVNGSLVEEEFGFKPQWSLVEGYGEIRDEIIDNAIEHWNTYKYIRAKRLKMLDLA
jgi:nucleoside-diphosphate-sugar epimerase